MPFAWKVGVRGIGSLRINRLCGPLELPDGAARNLRLKSRRSLKPLCLSTRGTPGLYLNAWRSVRRALVRQHWHDAYREYNEGQPRQDAAHDGSALPIERHPGHEQYHATV